MYINNTMNYVCLMYPVKDVSQYDKFSSDLCDGIISEIELFSRMLRIQKRRDEMAERSLMYGSEEGSTESMKSNDSKVALVLEGTINNTDELNGAAAKWRHFSPLSSEITFVSEDNIRTEHNHQGAVVTEEILWEVNLSRLFDTKLFFFGGIYWRASFGQNQKHSDYYYVEISPAQELARDCFLRCEFHLSRIPGCEEDANVVVPYSRRSKDCYRFPANEVKHKGFDKFISKIELHKLLSNGGNSSNKVGGDLVTKFELKLLLTGSISQDGTMVKMIA